ncbi:MAG: penicillin-binding transpeptidase domain-containing protein [Solirubrobacterales bacterium]
MRRRALPLAVLAFAAFVVGAVMAAGSAEQDMAERFVHAWAEQNFAAMHAELSDSAKQANPLDQFTAAYREAQTASTAAAINPGDAKNPAEGVVEVEVGIRTELFGQVDGSLRLRLDGEQIAWAPHLTFPDLQEGERVGRRLSFGDRAAILAKKGVPLAQGSARSSPLGGAAIDVAGEVGTPDADLRARLEKLGQPAGRRTGVSGLELAFNSRLQGNPGGELLAVPEGTRLPNVPRNVEGRALATTEQSPGQPVQTTIDPRLQEVTVDALGGRVGGIVVLDARSGAVRALAGAAYSSPRPPGSTFKVITTTAALEDDKVKLSDTFEAVEEINPAPEQGAAIIENAHDAACGGTFIETFAKSCNTVFAPLGVDVGEKKLVRMAERYGFNQPVTLYDEEATKLVQPGQMEIPRDIGTATDLAASSIGQGRVLATPLGMASIAQTVAAGGKRSPTPIVADPELRAEQEPVTVSSPEVARTLTGLMRAVVTSGTGTRADLGRIQVAGKTGTAELGPKPNQPPPKVNPRTGEQEDPEQIVDAWFLAFAPANRPRLAIAVWLADADADGGEVAAPLAAQVLDAGL